MALLSLWAIVLITLPILIVRYPTVSVVTLSVVGLAAYSLPALIGTSSTIPSAGEQAQLKAASEAATYVVALGWCGFAVSLGLASLHKPQADANLSAPSGPFLVAALALSVAGLALVVAQLGPLFFSLPRDQIAALGVPYLLWKWLVAAGLVAASLARHRLLIAAFVVMIVLVAVAGDRTTPVIAVMASLLTVFGGMTIKQALSSRLTWAAVALVFAIVMLVKPVYKILKGASFQEAVLEERPLSLLLQWEAFGIHELLEQVISHDFTYPLAEMLRSAAGQVLIVPSAFGIESSRFNTVLESTLFPNVTYGLGYNWWAQWYAVLGHSGVFMGGLVLGFTVVLLSRLLMRVSGDWKPLVLLCGAAVAVYVYRNSLENELAVLRQVVLAYLLITMPVAVVRWYLTRFSGASRSERVSSSRAQL